MFLVRSSINNPLLTNLVLFFVLIAGFLSWFAMPQEMFPVVQLDMVKIVTKYEGSSPEDVEKEVTKPIEDAFDGQADVDYIRSTSAEGRSTIIIKLKSGTNVDDFMQTARSALEQITDFPKNAEQPDLSRLVARFPVISIAVYGNVDRAYLYAMAEKVRERIQNDIKGVASVGVAGKRDWELWVVVDPEILAAHKISLTAVAQALQSNLKDQPGGSVKAVEGDILLRGRGNRPDARNIKKTVVKHLTDGGRITLADVAKVKYRLEEAVTIGRFNRKSSVNLTVSKTVDASTIQVSKDIRALVKKLRKELPPNVSASVFGDMSVYVSNRLNTVKSSGLVGLVLLLISLYLFLNFRVALITAMGIPVSFLIAVICLFYFGYTINMVSMFAFLIALGMIVDDAIIVNENIYRHMEQGMPAKEAAHLGATEVFWPVLASTLTTVAAFLPMFAITGTMGAFIQVIPVVVTASLVGSLLEAFGVLPSHAAEMMRVKQQRKQRRSRIDWKKWLDRYIRLLRWSVVNRYVVTALTVGILIVTMAYAKTRVPFNMFSHVDIGQFFVNVEAPNTYSLKDSEALAKKIEAAIYKTVGKKELDTMLTNVGFTFIDFNRFRLGSKYVQFIVDLKKRKPQGFIEKYISPVVSLKFDAGGTRERSNTEILKLVRKAVAKIPGVERLSIRRPAGGPAGSDLEVAVSGTDSAILRAQAEKLVTFLRKQNGVYDVRHDIDLGKREIQYSVNARGRKLGITQKQIADIIRTGFLGLEVVYVTRGENRIPVRLIFNERIRSSSDLSNLKLTLANGKTVHLGDIAKLEEGQALSTINRRNKKRLATVQAEVDSKVITPLKLTKLIQKEFKPFLDRNDKYQLLFLGEKKNAEESFSGMGRALILALAIIYFILSALFRSLLDPLVVMFAIPFAIIGVVIGHSLFGYNLQFLSMIGFIALSGIVVNDSLILVDFAKKQRARGMARFDAIVEAGRVRIRPILLTSITTFLGISPLIFFATGQTAFLSPMAVSLGFGLLFATVLILVAIPCFYLIADDMREGVKRLFGRQRNRDRAA